MALGREVAAFFAEHSLQRSAPASADATDAQSDADFDNVVEDLKALWSSQPANQKGGRLWRERALGLMTRLDRMRPAVTTRQRVKEWMVSELKAASNGFKPSVRTSWRPFLIVCLRLGGCEVVQLLGLIPTPKFADLRNWLTRGMARLQTRFLPHAEGSTGKKRAAPPEETTLPPAEFPPEMTAADALRRIEKAGSAKGFFRGLEASALRRVYRNLARLVHPDKCTDPRAKVCFQKLVTFYEDVGS